MIVYYTGGTRFSYAHLIYVPIILAAYFYKIKGGVITAVTGGLFLGPFMPLNTDTMVSQGLENWSFRMSMLIIIGAFSGYLFSLLESQLEKVNQIAYYDPETGLPNKIKLKQAMETEIAAENDFYLIILSINNFIDIYKVIGFMNFSNYIKELLQYIKNFKNLKNKIYYINENKYGIILKKEENEELLIYLNKFVEYMDHAVKFNHLSIFNDISLGISNYPEQSQIADELLDQAFVALKKANSKKLQFWQYQQEDSNFKDNNIQILADINQSIINNDFEIYYQPKINLLNNNVETLEALIRWNHPQKGFMSPGKFIPIVEQSSLIEPLTEWVIKQVLSDIDQFNQNKEKENYSIAINISARNLQHPNFAESLIKNLELFKINPERLSLEITETDLILEIKENIKKLQRLKQKGIKIYLDDFGKGYSSLKYLKELPVDYLKIDRYFIKNIGEEKATENIINSIINMAHALDLKVVAEGVETKEQLDFLTGLNCDYAQGYYFARPDTKENIIKWLAEEEKYNFN
ncbi:putative bifunctional diguanylate cyclase/phosphodiesterase [Halanaerobium saccharolyticum]|uniref:putative bifunctional diguanylate cyclase/phosphodiesterase n=1 Tax=Halanaerobium saccharolyticum TaxID=43595 RepID=UPI0010627321|nr:GGDEF domain-containing phosphodiesterase [Halanaerobium saccharolyticum]